MQLTYKDRLHNVRDIYDLYTLRDELIEEHNNLQKLIRKEPTVTNINNRNELTFWLNKVDSRIKELNSSGCRLDQIKRDVSENYVKMYVGVPRYIILIYIILILFLLLLLIIAFYPILYPYYFC